MKHLSIPKLPQKCKQVLSCNIGNTFLFQRLKAFYAIILTFAVLSAVFPSCNKSTLPDVFTYDAASLAISREKYLKGDAEIVAEVDRIVAGAEKAKDKGPFSVVSKSALPPSGNKHDYMSIGPYWWPNPDTENGLPYIRRDGVVNPEYYTFGDLETLSEFSGVVNSLSQAYFFTGREEFAERAVFLIRTWFIDSETYMNPHLNYGQSVPGIAEGRQFGIIDTRRFVTIIEGIGFIKDSKAWSETDQTAMQQWFIEFLTWMQESELGKAESQTLNNHGTWYDVQCIVYALFSNQPEKASAIIEDHTKKRLATQIKEDGSQPHELARTQSWSYSLMNLDGFFTLARLAKKVNIDLFNYTVDGRIPLKQALDFFIPYLRDEKEWEYPQISKLSYHGICELLRQAHIFYDNREYEELLIRVGDVNTLRSLNLYWPYRSKKP